MNLGPLLLPLRICQQSDTRCREGQSIVPLSLLAEGELPQSGIV